MLSSVVSRRHIVNDAVPDPSEPDAATAMPDHLIQPTQQPPAASDPSQTGSSDYSSQSELQTGYFSQRQPANVHSAQVTSRKCRMEISLIDWCHLFAYETVNVIFNDFACCLHSDRVVPVCYVSVGGADGHRQTCAHVNRHVRTYCILHTYCILYILYNRTQPDSDWITVTLHRYIIGKN